MKRLRIKIAGESGSGLLSTGEILAKAFRRLGFSVVSDREYPSLIKGGHSCFTLNVSAQGINALSNEADIMMAIDRPSFQGYSHQIKEGGILIHGYERLLGLKDIEKVATEKSLQVVHLPAREIAEECGGNVLMVNMVLIGMIWKVIGLDYEVIAAEVEEKFKDKPKILALDLKCLEAGYTKVEKAMEIETPKKIEKKLFIDGNKALSLGALHAGMRAYYAYPMSPASTILTHVSEMGPALGVAVKQAEDEISAAQMALGSMYMGTRALTATSGGGYDLMTETVSLAGIIETPLVIVIAQRPGPGTGLPTWTMQGDLNLAIHSSHGEFPRLVLAVSEPSDCFDLIQHAFNYAEKYQIPVLVLTEKVVAESHLSVDVFEEGKIAIERGLVEGEELSKLERSDRYRITENGLSKRWIPGSSDTYYFANGDEHEEDGSLTEDEIPSQRMYEKRMKKVDLILENLPEPKIYGVEKDADISFIGWGSSKTTMLDIIDIYAEKGVSVNYLHYEFLYPLKTTRAAEFFENNKNVCLIEGNYQGQFGEMLSGKLKRDFAAKLLKFNGRPFFIEDVINFIDGQK